jgi:hypothetical protein
MATQHNAKINGHEKSKREGRDTYKKEKEYKSYCDLQVDHVE